MQRLLFFSFRFISFPFLSPLYLSSFLFVEHYGVLVQGETAPLQRQQVRAPPPLTPHQTDSITSTPNLIHSTMPPIKRRIKILFWVWIVLNGIKRMSLGWYGLEMNWDESWWACNTWIKKRYVNEFRTTLKIRWLRNVRNNWKLLFMPIMCILFFRWFNHRTVTLSMLSSKQFYVEWSLKK